MSRWFGEIEIDREGREVEIGGQTRVLQPQAFGERGHEMLRTHPKQG